ncbi:unnamed protein product [Cyclocybe aegerita]|uniref:FK506-binding protein n=1 Tax=Cyclocybe aegerita TaxID=1973307 RepID=A0A8S0VW99_CYCAE|nr:unnamed protein product [Cyclocybe aegerita]
MATSLGIWHLVLKGGEEKGIVPPCAIQITNVSYGEEIADASSRGVVKLTFQGLSQQDSDGEDDEDQDGSASGLAPSTTVLCALTPGKIEHAPVSLILEEEMPYAFNLTGKNTVYLTGNYIDQGHDQDPFDSDSEDADSEDAYDLREVSSDVEMHPDDLDGIDSDASRFEEVTEEPSKNQKRPRDSDAAAEEEKGSKSEKKNKKLKGEGGKAVDVEAAPAQNEEKRKDKKKKEKSGDQGETKGEGKEKEKYPKKTLAGGVVIQDAKVGTGPMAKKGNTVRMRYVGKLTNGKEFDKNVSGKPFAFHLGKGEVIKGWDEGIVGMQVGGERILTIPPKMGYGGQGQKGIPANSTLVFDVKLLEIK